MIGLVTLWVGIKETTAAMPLAVTIPAVLGGAAATAGVVWCMARPMHSGSD